MPLSVTPSKQLIVSTEDGEDGDLLKVTLEDGSSVILTLRLLPGFGERIVRDFEVEPRLYPHAFRGHINDTVRRIVRFGQARELKKLYEEREDPAEDLYDTVYRNVTKRVYVQYFEVGETPSFSLGYSQLVNHQDYSPWILPSAVKTLAPASEWEAVVMAARLRAET